MQKNQRVADMAAEVLARQVCARTAQAGETTEAGRQLEQLRDGLHLDASAGHWQEDMARKRAAERGRARREEGRRARQEENRRAQRAAWKAFMQAELWELELRKDDQLAKALGKPLPGEAPAVLQRLAAEDRRQAEEGLVALIRNGKVFYKHVEELSEEDMPARSAASRMRTMWLKERRDRWLGRGEG